MNQKRATGGVLPRSGARRVPDASGLKRLSLPRQNPHSFFLFCAATILAGTIVLDLVLHKEVIDTFVSASLLVCTSVLGIAAVVFGERVPVWVGMVATGVFATGTLLFVGPLGDAQSAISSLQELPILSFYLAWFVKSPLNRVILIATLVLFSIALATNPVFWSDGPLGPSPAVQGILVAVCCFEVGTVLWRGSERKVAVDQLTGALTRAAFLGQLEAALVRAGRNNTPLSLVVVDFDYFKELNDTQGHAAGDAALRDSVRQWQAELRGRDLVGRSGGDEFAILLHGTEPAEAEEILCRLRRHSAHAWSWGITGVRAGDDAERMFARADDLLYAAKRGRV